MIVSKSIKFDAAHWLPNYEGKCANLHGHTWKVEVACSGEKDKKTGMVIDFKWIKKVLEAEIIERFDHTCLNESFCQTPTAENLAKYIFDRIMLEWIQGPDEAVQVEYVKVWETEDSMAEYNIEDWNEEVLRAEQVSE